MNIYVLQNFGIVIRDLKWTSINNLRTNTVRVWGYMSIMYLRIFAHVPGSNTQYVRKCGCSYQHNNSDSIGNNVGEEKTILKKYVHIIQYHI